jgi:hypothetical protein
MNRWSLLVKLNPAKVEGLLDNDWLLMVEVLLTRVKSTSAEDLEGLVAVDEPNGVNGALEIEPNEKAGPAVALFAVRPVNAWNAPFTGEPCIKYMQVRPKKNTSTSGFRPSLIIGLVTEVFRKV